MSTRSCLACLWLASVAGLCLLLPPAQWDAAAARGFAVGLVLITGAAYGLLAVCGLIGWLGRRIAGPARP